ncbi:MULTISPECIES: phosphotransferase [Acidobacterium]|nr:MULTISPECIES: phosphotransferase [Acidobacterium]
MERRTRNPFARPGWIGDGIRWLESVTGIRVAEQNPYEQYNAGHGFTLIRFQMEDGSAYWLKATSGQNARELPVTLALSQLCGRYLPQVIDYRPDWNAWLSREEAVCLETWPEDCNEAQQILCRAVDALAAIQVSTIGSANTLFRAGASDQRPMTLAAGAESFFCYLEEAMGHQTSRKVPRISSARLGELRRLVEDSCARLDALNFPVTVVHGDMNLGNLLIGPEHCQITDWAEAYVGFPLCTLEHLLLLHPYSDPVRQRNEHHALKERYRCLLLAGYDAVQIDEAFVLAPLIAAFSALYGRGTWLTSPARDDPKRQSYARMLARHMDRAARKPAFLGTRCRHSTHAGMASVSA